MKKLRTLFCLLLALCLTASAALAFEYPEGTLHRGIEGYRDEVEFLQYQLFYAGYLGEDIDEVDGIFGKKTEAAVKEFQRDHGLEVSGIVDPETQMLLDELWENSMEPQGGGEDPYPYCYIEYYDNGTSSVVMCSRHMQIAAGATDAVSLAWPETEQIIEGLQTGTSFWMTELNSTHQLWADLRPEYAQLIANHQEAFMAYYDAQTALWQAHFGALSVEALERGMNMLADHCTRLCVLLSGDI